MNEERYHSSVKEWYCEAYPTDPIGPDLPDTIAEVKGDFFQHDIQEDTSLADEPVKFSDYMLVMENGGDVYDLMGEGNADSLVRERIFEELADILETDEDEIYNLWLHGN